MYIHELTTFLTVADQGSFLKAAQELYTTPASIMNQMNKLERLVGVKLLERTNQGTTLTAAGKSIYEDARRMIAFSEEAIRKARELAGREEEVIRIGTSILRPCRRLIELWDRAEEENPAVQLCIVPFDDDPVGLDAVLSTLGTQIDCIVSPCDSDEWRKKHSIYLLEQLPCRIAVPRKHRLAKKKSLSWQDLEGETLMIVKSADTPVLRRMREEIAENHPRIRVADALNFYDTSVFNECERMGYLMETLDIWAEVHPGLVTLPMEWEYTIPYGIIYAKRPSKQMLAFLEAIQTKRP